MLRVVWVHLDALHGVDIATFGYELNLDGRQAFFARRSLPSLVDHSTLLALALIT